MPREANIVPNLRVDIPDLLALGQEYSRDLFKLHLERWVQKNFAVITEGFRVEIANQVTNPGLFTIINGVAFTRDGQLVNNEEELNASRSLVLIANGTYFVEVEFITDFADVDARAFWDTTFDNGTDPSGDDRPDGREFSQNVATRIAPDWRIVRQVSTSGFERTTNPDSLHIPIAVLTVAGSQITGGSSTPARTNLAKASIVAATSLQALDTRHFPDSFQLRVDPGGASTELLSVTANDRGNGILTLGAAAGFAHTAGTRLANEDVTPTQLLDERTIPELPTSGTEDARPRFFQADEERGAALMQDPYNEPGKSDLELKALKDLIDGLAAEFRELKFGSATALGMGNTAPPTTFPAAPRWFDTVGSVAGGRAHTVSVGDGVNSFGDFNSNASNATSAIQAAIDTLPTVGGILYVKSGTYDIGATSVSIGRGCKVIGDGSNSTVIRATDAGGAVAVSVNSLNPVGFENLQIAVDAAGTGTALFALEAVQMVQSGVKNCVIQGLESQDTQEIIFENCTFISPASGGNAVDGAFQSCRWVRCTFDHQATAAANRNVRATTATSNVFVSCVFSALNGNDAVFESTGATTGLTIRDCVVSQTGVGPEFIRCVAGDTNVLIDGIDCQSDGGLGSFIDCTNVTIRSCITSFAADNAGVSLLGTTGEFLKVLDSRFTQTTTSGAAGIGRGIDFAFASQVVVQGCFFENADIAIRFNTLFGFQVSDCTQVGSAGRSRSTFESDGATPGVTNGVISNFTVRNLSLTGATNAAFFFMDPGGAASLTNVSFTSCVCNGIGSSSVTNGFGVRIVPGVRISRLLIQGCVFSGVNGLDRAEAISVEIAEDVSIVGNVVENLGASVLNTWNGIFLPDVINAVIGDNQFTDLGNGAAATMGNSVIQVGSNVADQSESVAITGNVIQDIQSANQHYGIFLFENGERVVIANNILNCANTVSVGIFVDILTIGNVDIQSVIIDGNVVGGCSNGIFVILSETTSLKAGHIAVTGNALRDWTTAGITAFGFITEALDQVTSWNVSGNTLESEEDSVTGIAIRDLSRFVINSNQISLTSTTGVSDGIASNGRDCFDGVVNGNMVYSAATTGDGIDLNNCDNVCVSGNNVHVNTTGNALRLDTNSFAAANVLRNAGAGLQLSPGTSLNLARKDQESNSAAVPGVFGEIDLNLRTV